MDNLMLGVQPADVSTRCLGIFVVSIHNNTITVLYPIPSSFFTWVLASSPGQAYSQLFSVTP